MDEKRFQLFAGAMSFLCESTWKRYTGESSKATIGRKRADEKGDSKDGGNGT